MDRESEDVSRRRIMNAVVAGTASSVVISTTQGTADAQSDSEWPDSRSVPWPMEDANARRTNSVPEDQAPRSDRIVQKWTADFESGDPLAPVVGTHGLIAATGRPDVFTASLDLETGKTQWTARVDERTHASPIASGDRVYVVYDNEVSLRASDSGTLEGNPEMPVPGTAFRFMDLVATDERILFVAESGVLGAINRRNHRIEWVFDVQRRHAPVKVAATSETAFLITKGTKKDGCERTGVVHAVDLSTGVTEWSQSLPAGAREVTIADDAVIVGVVGEVHAFDPDSGARIWQRDTKTERPGFAVRDDVLIVGGYRQLSAVDWRTGAVMWVKPFDSRHPSPAISGETVFIAGSGRDRTNWKAQIKTFELSTGRQKATHHLDEERIRGPAIANGALYASTDSGTVYAFDGGS